ncbi:hypothetical protein D3C81_2109770 [compost metagenome]
MYVFNARAGTIKIPHECKVYTHAGFFYCNRDLISAKSTELLLQFCQGNDIFTLRNTDFEGLLLINLAVLIVSV